MIEVVAAILIRDDGQLLIAQRPAGKPQAGLWEFPGGKIEAGETPRQALTRELAEELALELPEDLFCPFQTLNYERLTLTFYQAKVGPELQPVALEGQIWRWVPRAALRQYRFPSSNAEVIAALLAGH